MIPGFFPVILMGAAGGVVPGAANWTDISAAGIGDTNTVNMAVSEPILLRATLAGTARTHAGEGFLYAIVNGVSFGGDLSNGYFDFTIADGDPVYFSASGTGEPSWTLSTGVTVEYKSPGSPTFDTTLDTFTVSLTAP